MFLTEKQEYLNQAGMNSYEQIHIYNTQSIDLQMRLNKELKRIKNIIFNNNKIYFTESFDDNHLGFIEYEIFYTV